MKLELRGSILCASLIAAATLPASASQHPSAVAATRPAVHTIDTQHSKMTVSVYKQGIFAALGDNHTIDAPVSSGRYDPTSKNVELTIETAKMQVLDQHSRDGVQKTMDNEVLEISKYPTIVFRSTSIDDRDTRHWMVNGDLTLHGVTRPITLQVTKSDASHFTGSTMIRQTTFGITPIKVMGGAVSVKDDVKVDFDVVLSQ